MYVAEIGAKGQQKQNNSIFNITDDKNTHQTPQRLSKLSHEHNDSTYMVFTK